LTIVPFGYRILDTLTVAADGDKADIAKPMKGIGSGIFEIAVIKDRLKRLKQALR
jgi:hypothetical protein